MPIYEYVCDSCTHEFERLVRGSETPACPECGSRELTRKLSLPRVQTEGTRQKGLQAAKRRDKKLGEDRMRERVEYESSHD
ncbi:MAG: zinc ribbon domain-containing protein [Gemmatimonadota bacterium]